MRKMLFVILSSLQLLSACGGGHTVPGPPRLVVEPDDGRVPLLEVIASASDNIRLTIYALTDLQSVVQTPAAPAASIAKALIDKAQSGVSVRVIVDQSQYAGTSANAQEMQQTVAALRNAGALVYSSNTNFCFTHQKTFVVDGPTPAKPALEGTAIIMSLNLTPGYFGGTRDYAVITNHAGVVAEISRVFDSDFALANPSAPANPAGPCLDAHYSWQTAPPPSASDTPSVKEWDLLWSPVNSKPKLLQLMASVKQSLVLTTEELTDSEMVCQIQAVAQSAAKPSVSILLSGDTGSNAAAVKTLLDLGLSNLSIRIMPGQPTASVSPPIPTPLYMHGKQVIADGVQAFIGSENLTNTSLIQNRELGTLFTDPVMILRLQSVFTNDFASGHSVAAKACTTGDQDCATIHCPAGH